jgi:hypothetical protein
MSNNTLKTEQDKIKHIKELAKNVDSTTVRKEIGKIWGLKKTARNEKWRKIFGGEESKILKTGKKIYKIEGVKNTKFPAPKVEVKGDKAVVDVKNSKVIYTLDELIEVCGINMDEWAVVKFWGNSYGDNFQAKAEFAKRKDGPTFKQIVEELKEDALNYSPNVDKISYQSDGKGLLLEICCFDLHLGKMGWKPSDGGDWDINIAKETFKNAVVELTEKARKIGNISKICFPIGNDYLTCDNSNNTTYASTPQSVDSRFPKVFKEGRKLLVWAIDYLKQFAPVDVVYVVSNHDTDSMFHLADALECWYRNDENVTVENSPAPRKYYRFKNNLIIYDHGDKVKFEKLPVVASVEYPEWSLVKNREFHVGHVHNERSYRLDVADHNAAIIRVIPALSGSDYYHNSNGYVGAKQRAQAFVWHPENGLETILYSKSNN